jgi:dCTP deaminase
MILTGPEILRRIDRDIVIDPFEPDRLNPNSYNLSLHDELLVYEEIVLDLAVPNRYRRIRIPEEGLVLEPNRLYLGRTQERTETRNLAPMIAGRSSLGRLGLCVQVGSGLGHVGFCGYWTLEMHAIQPLRIYPGIQICQIIYHEVVGEIAEYSSDKYQHNQDIQTSLMFRELGTQEPNEQQLELDFEAYCRETLV